MKKILAFLLCAVLLLTVAAPAVLAETMTEPAETTAETTEAASQPTEGTTESTEAATEPADPSEATEAPTEPADPTEAIEVPTDGETEPAETTEPVTEPSEPAEAPEPETFEGISAVNYTDVGPLLPPVVLSSGPKKSAARNAGDSNDGLVVNKTAVENEDGTYTLTMEAYTTGTVTTTTTAVPTDIILVLDESGSMADYLEYRAVYPTDTEDYYVLLNGRYDSAYYCRGSKNCTAGWYSQRHGGKQHSGQRYTPKTSANDTTEGHVQFYASTSKRDALVSAANAFAANVAADAKANSVDHRIAVVAFASNAYTRAGLTDVSKDTGLTTIQNAINRQGQNGGTMIDRGLDNAVSIFRNDQSTGKRNRVVVVFTDGAPGMYGDWEDASRATASSAISKANTLKNTYKATVYTIGVVNGADPTAAISDSDTSNNGRLNRFLHYVSSNYPNATDLYTGGDGSNKGYYLSANNADALQTIFEKISQEIQTPSIELGEETVVQDIVAPQFTIPEGSTVKLYTADYNGSTFGERQDVSGDVQATVNGNTLSVTGFDYTENFVSQTRKSDGTYGKKLIIEVTVAMKSGFLGGNDVATNGENSGIYSDGKLVKAFPVPTVDIPVADVTVTVTDKNVYLRGNLTQDQLLAGSTVKCGDVVLMQDGEAVTLEDWQTQYVNIEISKPAAMSDLRTDGEYTLTATVTPKTGSGSKSNSATGNVRVFVPEITWKDSLLALDATPDYMKENHVSVRWVHGAEAENNMIGDRPTLSYGFAPTESPLRTETYVTVHVQIDGVDVTNKVTFLHEKCDLVDFCSFDKKNGQFLIHIGTFDLIIKKDGWKDIDEKQSFLFRITGPNGFTMEVTIQGNGSKTIKGLQLGSYTVEEVTGWSWRYQCKNNEQTVGATDVNNGSAALTFINERTFVFWLNGGAFEDNRWRRNAE